MEELSIQQELIGEVKLDKSKISLSDLKVRSRNLIEKLVGYEVSYRRLGMEDM